MNELDSRRFVGLMSRAGWEESAAPDDADLVLLNTCSVRDKAEQARVSIRNVRRKAKDDLDALKEVGEDEIARAEKELDATTKSHVDSIDDALKRKEAELLEV